ncbi:hypothetical protein AVI51_04185 [Piscirickettsia salmonis]|uniref:IcmC protein n=1 Tax=Piscirickettsia salmonis TaxID=1238 RepID=A0A9Q5VCG0_PISSA|nr:hypothetical protein [Piscirickettsia salmonis]ALA25306.1 type IV secretion system protein IcmC [Piscirickettsia salmonis]APS45542.1 hypothetical protein AVI48_14940 [Piscirickettsia salmonis]APS46199.1 hypothetical protein AVI49_00160 [Piscirickettsia salmonis]APS50130.1 hypothetical protein AVI50_04225 [Piscirickettsia salmonis]APS53330.1 hypothetical protein AVI51_04185 [Piscirickettsia salmonis]
MNKHKLMSSSVLFVIILIQIFTQCTYASSGDVATSFIQVSRGWQSTLVHIAIFVEFMAALSGVILIIFGLIQLRQGHSGQGGQQQQTAKVGIFYLIIGGFLLALGSVIIVLSNSVNSADINAGVDILHNAHISKPTNLYEGVIYYVLMPFLHLINVIGPVVGLITLCVGVHRLRYHSNPQIMSMYRRSPMATGFYFFVGSVLLFPFYLIKALSGSMFKTPQILSQYCGDVSGEKFLSYFSTLQNNTTVTFSNGAFQCVPVSATSTSDNLLKLAYAILFVAGLISFLRGIFLLTRLGEHMGGPDASASKVAVHIIAGMCAINANVFVEILRNTYNIIVGLKT